MAAGDLENDPLEALRSGDPGPFEDFVRRHARQLVGFFVRLGAGAHEAEDLTQEVFLRLHRAAAAYRPRERYQAYVMRIARNAWIDRTRRRAARPELRSVGSSGGDSGTASAAAALDVGALLPTSEPGPGDRATLREEAARVQAAVAELSDAQRMAFELGVIQGLPYEEIGRLLDVPVGTVKSRVFTAVRRVRAKLGFEEEST